MRVVGAEEGWIAPQFRKSKARKRAFGGKSCVRTAHPKGPCGGRREAAAWVNRRLRRPGWLHLSVHSLPAALRRARSPRKFHRLSACRTAGFAAGHAIEGLPCLV